MNKISLILVVPILLFLSLVCCQKSSGEESSFVFAFMDKEIFPYQMGDGDKIPTEKPGVSIEMLTRTAAKCNVKLTFVRLPWKRCLHKLRLGEVDGVIASYRKDRMAYGVYPMKDRTPNAEKRISSDSYFLYVLSGSKITWDPETNKIGNLTGVIGAPLGYSIVSDLRKWGYTVEESLDPESTLEKLLLNRIAALAGHEMTIDSLIHKKPQRYKKVRKVKPFLIMKPYFLIFSKQFVKANPDLSRKLWDKLQETREQEMLDILAKYY